VERYQEAILESLVVVVGGEAWGDSKAAVVDRSISLGRCQRVCCFLYHEGPDFSLEAASGFRRANLQITRPPWTTA